MLLITVNFNSLSEKLPVIGETSDYLSSRLVNAISIERGVMSPLHMRKKFAPGVTSDRMRDLFILNLHLSSHMLGTSPSCSRDRQKVPGCLANARDERMSLVAETGTPADVDERIKLMKLVSVVRQRF